MILSTALQAEIDTLFPEKRVLTHEELSAIQAEYQKLPLSIGPGLARDTYFTADEGLRENYAQPEENSRWDTVGTLPLVVRWSLTKVEANMVIFTSSIQFVAGEERYRYHLNRFWESSTETRVLSEETIQVPSSPWLPKGAQDVFFCYCSEYPALVAPYVKELFELSTVILV